MLALNQSVLPFSAFYDTSSVFGSQMELWKEEVVQDRLDRGHDMTYLPPSEL